MHVSWKVHCIGQLFCGTFKKNLQLKSLSNEWLFSCTSFDLMQTMYSNRAISRYSRMQIGIQLGYFIRFASHSFIP
ncbi:hypothetical protein ACS0TY_030019 [Phlomoides rotata]